MKKKPLIGIVTWKVGENSIGVTAPYVKYFQTFGNVVFVDMYHLNTDLDLLVLPGGRDVNPARYNQLPDFLCGMPDMFKEAFDKYMLPQYIEIGTPIFGICRGLQTLGVYMGASMIQDMYHPTNISRNRVETVHTVKGIDWNGDVVGHYVGKHFKPFIEVNSLHHQVLDSDTIPDTIKVLLRYTPHNGFKEAYDYGDDIEAIHIPSIKAIAVQWHPEECRDPFSRRAIKYLLSLKQTPQIAAIEDNVIAN